MLVARALAAVSSYDFPLAGNRLTVPIRRFLPVTRLIQTIREMSLALESVCDTSGLKVIDDAATRLVAEKIVELSLHGVHGVATLHAMTVKEFKSETCFATGRGLR